MQDEQAKSWFALNVSIGTRVWLAAGSTGLLLAGTVLSVSSWQKWAWWVDLAPAVATLLMAIGVVCFTVGGIRLMQRAPKGGSAYAPFIFGLGILMNGVGGTGVVGVAGLIHSQQLTRGDEVAIAVAEPATGDATKDVEATSIRVGEQRRARFVLLAGAMAFIGSIFYIALSLYRKEHEAKEPFDVGKLVSGAALRSGEAMLFVLCFVLLTQVHTSSELDGWLPVAGLLLGMFVKSGERMVFNLAERIFDFAQAIIPGARRKEPASARTREDDVLPLDEAASAGERAAGDRRTNGSKPPPPMPAIEGEPRTHAGPT